jgi:hypothetical protein
MRFSIYIGSEEFGGASSIADSVSQARHSGHKVFTIWDNHSSETVYSARW